MISQGIDWKPVYIREDNTHEFFYLTYACLYYVLLRKKIPNTVINYLITFVQIDEQCIVSIDPDYYRQTYIEKNLNIFQFLYCSFYNMCSKKQKEHLNDIYIMRRPDDRDGQQDPLLYAIINTIKTTNTF
jgi:hypothetical protein